MNKGIRNLIITITFVLTGVCNLQAQDISAYMLKCENLISPIGLENKHPRFSWICKSEKRNFHQKAYRIMVASSPEMLSIGKADMWDSKWQYSSQSILVPYEGRGLSPGKQYYWTVAIMNSDGEISDFSSSAKFITGLFDESDWHNATWISFEHDNDTIVPFHDEPYARENIPEKTIGTYHLPQFRKCFNINRKDIKKALAFVCGLGHFDLYLNGEKVSDHFLDAGWTNYTKEAQYVVFDVSDKIIEGENVTGVMLGNGFYNIPNERYYKITGSYGAPKMRMLLTIEYKDGTIEKIVSDHTWRVTESPITYSSIFGGEDYDATKLKKGWTEKGFDDSDWQRPILNKSAISLYSAPGTEIKVHTILPPTCVSVNPEDNYIYDFGQNFSGIIRLKLKGRKGQTVIIRPGELLSEGRIDQRSSGSPHFYRYTLNADTVQTWQPQFTYYGLRYAQIEGAVPFGSENPDSLPQIIEISGLHTTAGIRQTGAFSCSNPLFNKIYTLIDWAIRSNFTSVLTDCPHREKLGWQEEAHLMQHSLMYRYDMASIYPKIIRDLCVAQLENGCVPTIAPEFVRFAGGFEDTPEWGSTAIISPWYYYKWYGDDSLLKKYYPMMQRYAAYLDSRVKDGIIAYGLGDWYDIGANPPGYAQLTSNGVTATAIYFTDLNILKQTASHLGLKSDEEKYANLAENIKESYNRHFYKDTLQFYDRGSQTANAISYVTGLADGERALNSIYSLVKDIETRGYALTAGDIGYRYVLKALTKANRPDVIYNMNSRYDVPGYGWQIAHGATALTES